MSRTRNGGIRCDWCGRISRSSDACYARPDGTAGYIAQPEWERFPGADPARENVQTGRDICEECAADRCPACGGGRIVRTTPGQPGPHGWGGRCRECGHSWGLTVARAIGEEPAP